MSVCVPAKEWKKVSQNFQNPPWCVVEYKDGVFVFTRNVGPEIMHELGINRTEFEFDLSKSALIDKLREMAVNESLQVDSMPTLNVHQDSCIDRTLEDQLSDFLGKLKT